MYLFRKYAISLCMFLVTTIILLAQNKEVLLWDQTIPCESTLQEEIEERDVGRIIRKVHTPSMTIFRPPADKVNGTAVIICPGGGYTILAWDWEGTSIAQWFNSIGVTAFVLKYRLPHWENEQCRDKVALTDAQQAMRIVRHRATEFAIDSGQIGIMGFSAGGHLASTLSTHFDTGNPEEKYGIENISCRPDFSILVYPVISCNPAFAHQGSCKNLMGDHPSIEQRDHFSNEKQVTADTPPAILIHAADDTGVLVEHSISYYQALIKNEVPVAMHLFPTGGHGFSMGKEGSYESAWPELVHQWMLSMDFID